MSELSELYDHIKKKVREYEKKAADLRAARNKTIPECLQAYRTKHGITKEEFASKLGIARMQLFRWERGESIPGAEAMKKLEDLGIVSKVE